MVGQARDESLYTPGNAPTGKKKHQPTIDTAGRVRKWGREKGVWTEINGGGVGGVSSKVKSASCQNDPVPDQQSW